MIFTNRRKFFFALIGFGIIIPIMACGKGNVFMKKQIGLNVVVYSYFDRPIFDIYFNGIELGLANTYGGTGTITGVSIPFGPQVLTWRLGGPRGMAHNGETVNVKNSLAISPGKIPENTRYLGIHIYSDNTAELSFSQYIPDRTPRGDAILESLKNDQKR
jgi:hypothetical protein